MKEREMIAMEVEKRTRWILALVVVMLIILIALYLQLFYFESSIISGKASGGGGEESSEGGDDEGGGGGDTGFTTDTGSSGGGGGCTGRFCGGTVINITNITIVPGIIVHGSGDPNANLTNVPNICGNGIPDPTNNEQCDDGNMINGDGCSDTCQLEDCGDGIVQASPNTPFHEECDDGNFVNIDTCIIDPPVNYECKNAFCGDGYVCSGSECINHFPPIFEACDEGENNGMPGSNCNNRCQVENIGSICGDGIISGSENCDGNNLGGATCQNQGYATGNLVCNNECQLDFGACRGTNTGNPTNPTTTGTPGDPNTRNPFPFLRDPRANAANYVVKENRGEFSVGEYVELGLKTQDRVKFTLSGTEYSFIIISVGNELVTLEIAHSGERVIAELGKIHVLRFGDRRIALKVDAITEEEGQKVALITIVSIETGEGELEEPQLEPLLEGYLANENNSIEASVEESLIDRIGRNKIIFVLILIVVAVIGLIIYNIRKVRKIKDLTGKRKFKF